ncbi:winged helix-turn-helix transcriptional regulator [Bittarella massiliensis (ex Durand et al. 2017)]|uniref:winged helix-turn-helix transcriptional regulator n=1 Tax=Bittarella massiliensis (ex Durand et al. 2017) TaxID=1720313 RepID=UPI00073E9269|nr:helix-turn-helix domain-containing protein [Bittarella massiliensis (ex Durand et al. 2017)]
MSDRLPKIADSEDTSFGYTLSLLNGRWKLLILYNLGKGEVIRFNELQRLLGRITYKTLSASLKEMEADGLVFRRAYPQIPPKVEYGLTERGRSLLPLLREMCRWGEIHRPASPR